MMTEYFCGQEKKNSTKKTQKKKKKLGGHDEATYTERFHVDIKSA